MLDTSRFRDADRYASYLKTPAGRLRSELAWENLRCCLPRAAAMRRALDLGGGTGFAAVRLAQMGFEVVLLDSSKEMLRIARQETEPSASIGCVSFLHADAARLPELFEDAAFDVVVCHNLLEYVADPFKTVCDIARVLRSGGLISALARNRAGEVLRAAIKEDWKLAQANLSAETVVDSLFGQPVRVFSPAQVRDMMVCSGLEVIAERGVRVFSDYVGVEGPSGESYDQVLDLELALGARPEFAAIARYSQWIAVSAKEPSREDAAL